MAADKIVQGDLQGPPIDMQGSRGLPSWLHAHHVSLAFTTYEASKLVLVGLQPDGTPSVFTRSIKRCMGLARAGSSLWVSSVLQLWRFEDRIAAGQQLDGFDACFVPQVSYITADLDIHDVVVEDGGRVVFVATAFNCLATVDTRHGFVPLWMPPFVSKLVPEDRCHLNGLAVEDGRAAYVTCVSRSDVADGWRDRRRDGGCVIDVRTQEVVASGLSMPHSPRVHDGKLWLIEAGSGHLGFVDRARGRFERVTFLPGFGRGLDFVGKYALVGTSATRKDRTFQGLELDEQLAAKDAQARCGISIVDTTTGDVAQWLRIGGSIDEVFDVRALPGVRRPQVVGFLDGALQSTYTPAPFGQL